MQASMCEKDQDLALDGRNGAVRPGSFQSVASQSYDLISQRQYGLLSSQSNLTYGDWSCCSTMYEDSGNQIGSDSVFFKSKRKEDGTLLQFIALRLGFDDKQ